VLGGLVTQPSFLNAINNPSPGYLGTIIALYNIGCLAGCAIAAIWGIKLGRKRAVIVGCSIMIVGGAIQASTRGAGQLIAGRLISGVGNGKTDSLMLTNDSWRFLIHFAGINTSTIPMYVAETAQSHRRGRMVAVQLSVVIVSV
jgi:MFS family permease